MDAASGRVTTITDVNPELRRFALGDLKPVKWRSFDGMEIWGLLLTPSDAPAGRPLPTLVYIHGGPGGGFTLGLFPQFMHIVPQVDPYPTATMAGAGYAILFPMPRGGAGYGEAGQRAIVNGWGDADYKDIMAGVDRADRAGHRRSQSPWRDGRVVWRLHDELDRHADGPLQGGLGRREPERPQRHVLSLRGRCVPDRLLQAAVGKPRGLCRSFAADLRGQGDDAAADPARRGRSARADRRRVEVLPHAEGDGQDRRARNLSARRPRAARAGAAARADAPQPRVVREMDRARARSFVRSGNLRPLAHVMESSHG